MTEWYTPQQLGDRLQIDIHTLQAQARRAEIPGAKKIGNQWRFNTAKIDLWLSQTLAPPLPLSLPSETHLSPATLERLAALRAMRTKRT